MIIDHQLFQSKDKKQTLRITLNIEKLFKEPLLVLFWRTRQFCEHFKLLHEGFFNNIKDQCLLNWWINSGFENDIVCIIINFNKYNKINFNDAIDDQSSTTTK
jgi:hypothetical protein